MFDTLIGLCIVGMNRMIAFRFCFWVRRVTCSCIVVCVDPLDMTCLAQMGCVDPVRLV